jgi:hypothetical protein
MMNRKTISLLLTTLLVGALAGFFVGSSYAKRVPAAVNDLLARVLLTQAVHGATQRVIVLRALRDGDSVRAADLLERQLDGDLLTIRHAFPTASQEIADDLKFPAAIRMVNDYRKEFPHTPNPRIAPDVAAALSFADRPAN